MEYLKNLLGNISEMVRRMTVSQVVMLMAIIVGAVVGLVVVVGWVGSVAYQPLYAELDPAEAAEVTRYLSDNNIDYELSAGGTTIMVPETEVYEARLGLASQGLPNSGNVGYSIFDETNLGMTDFLQKLNFRRALEGELARTISTLREVKASRVHIVIPEERLFSEQQEEATASVVLKLRHRGGLAKSQISGITHLVASSVEGLSPGNITIVDYNGNLLSSGTGRDPVAAMSATQLEMTRQVENDLEEKAQSMLDGVLGPGKGIVRVTAELDFQQYTRTSENYDPNQTAIVSEQRTEGTNMASSKGAEDVEDREEDRSEVTVTNYEVSKTVESVQNAVGTIKRLSVAVMLDGDYKEVENADGVMETVYEPRPQEEVDRLSSIVKNAVGFSADRNDQMEVVSIAFDKSYFTEQQEAIDSQYTREFYYNIVKKVIIVLAVILVALYLRKRIKSFFAGLGKLLPPSRVRPTAPPSHSPTPQAQQEPEEAPEPELDIPEIVPEKRQVKLVDRMQKVAKDKPEEIAKVIKTIMVD